MQFSGDGSDVAGKSLRASSHGRKIPTYSVLVLCRQPVGTPVFFFHRSLTGLPVGNETAIFYPQGNCSLPQGDRWGPVGFLVRAFSVHSRCRTCHQLGMACQNRLRKKAVTYWTSSRGASNCRSSTSSDFSWLLPASAGTINCACPSTLPQRTVPIFVWGCGKFCQMLWRILSEVVANFVSGCGKFCQRLWRILSEVVANFVRGSDKFHPRLWQILSWASGKF